MACQIALEEDLQARSANSVDCETLVSVGLSILSWRGADTLNRSLESYEKTDLFSAFNAVQIVLPDPDQSVLRVANRHKNRIKTLPQNLGIMENMAQAASSMTTDYILMLENDCPLIEPKSEVVRQLEKSLILLKRDDVIMSRLRSVKFPGQAFTGLDKYRRLYDGSIKSSVIRGIRPDKRNRLSGYALYDGPDSIARHPTHFENAGDGFYLVGAEIMPWTNQSILIHRETFLETILPLARSTKTRRLANNYRNLEIELNSNLAWRRSGWKIACGPGLFTHERIGDRGYD